jgi:hypothetical protein
MDKVRVVRGEMKREGAGGVGGGGGGEEGPGGAGAVVRISHPRWGFDNLQRKGGGGGRGRERGRAGGAKGDRRAEWVGDGARLKVAPGRRAAEKSGAEENPWEKSLFKKELAETLYQRLLMSAGFEGLKMIAEIGKLRIRLASRLHKVSARGGRGGGSEASAQKKGSGGKARSAVSSRDRVRWSPPVAQNDRTGQPRLFGSGARTRRGGHGDCLVVQVLLQARSR